MLQSIDTIKSLQTLKELISGQEVEYFAKILVGSVLADEQIHSTEKFWIDSFIEIFELSDDLLHELRSLLDQEVPIQIEPNTRFSNPESAKHILMIVLEICAGDFDLHMNEIYFINHCAHILGISQKETQNLIVQESYRIHLENLDEFCSQLTNELANKLDKDIKHMVNDHDLNHRVFDDVLLSLEFSSHDDSIKDNNITKKEAIEKILCFILEGTHENGIWDNETDLCLQTLALREGLSQSEYNWLKQNTKTNYKLLIQ